jgi:pimeloyl-ACP methyl ester carboxylesterase
MTTPRIAALALASLMLAGCVTLGSAEEPIPVRLVPAPQPTEDRTLVIVLPGIGADAEDLERHEVAAMIQRSWPNADTVLTSAAFAYYAPEGRLVERLHDELVEPARRQGYRHIWLIGASLGGAGVLLYEHEHPGEVTGVMAFAPYLGGDETPEQIRQAGGLSYWHSPDYKPSKPNPWFDYPRMIWTTAREWLFRPEQANRIWVICGKDDDLRPDAQLLASSLPRTHYLEVPGGHRWSVWLKSLDLAVRKIRETGEQRASAGVSTVDENQR